MSLSAAPPLPATRIGWLGAVASLWMAFALVTGFAHGLELLAAGLISGRMVWFSREFAWMAPLSYALVMLPGAIGLAIIALIVRRAWTLALAAAAFATVGAFGLLLPYSQIARIASLILSLGIAAAMARVMLAHHRAVLTLSRRMAIVGGLAIIAMAVGQGRLRSATESRALAALPPARPGAPNVLLIILDTVRAASLSLYGSADRTTPNLEAWGSSGVVFDWSFSTAPWTLPSHASMFTGVWAGQQSGDWETPLNDTLPTLAEQFRDLGYLTAGFVGNMHYTAWDSGLGRGFAHYDDYRVSWGQVWRSSSYTQTRLFEELLDARSLGTVVRAFIHPDLTISPKHNFDRKIGEVVTREFLDWQAGRRDRPFFAFLNYFDAHQPYFAPPGFHHFAAARQGLAGYRAAIAYLDVQVDQVLKTLQQRGVLDNTLVVIAGDHGELFGGKNLYGHAHNLYLNVLRVPLVVRFPGRVPAGIRVSRPVSLRDLAATILDLTDAGSSVPGVSLAGAWTAGAAASPVLAEVTKAPNIESHYPTAKGPMQTVIDDRWQLIHNGDGREELFEYRADSTLAHDLASDADHADVAAALRQRLQELLRLRP